MCYVLGIGRCVYSLCVGKEGMVVDVVCHVLELKRLCLGFCM